MTVSGWPAARIPSSISVSIASAARVSERSARLAACQSVASGPSRASRTSQTSRARETLSARSASSRPVAAATGRTLSARRARMASASRNGFPPLAWAHARQNSSSASGDNRVRTSSPTASMLSTFGLRVLQPQTSQRAGDQVGTDAADRAGCEQEQHGQIGRAPGQVGDEAQRGIVRPVHVVDGQQERTTVGQVGADPEQTVQDAAQCSTGAVRVFHQNRLGQRCRALEQLRALCAVGPPPDGFEKLADNAERILPFQLGAGRRQHPHAATARVVPGGCQQHGLTDSGRAFHKQRRPVACHRRGNDLLDTIQLAVTFNQTTHVALAFPLPHRPAGSAGRRRGQNCDSRRRRASGWVIP